jgi:hypothetical protein
MKPNEQYFAAYANHEAEGARLRLFEQLLDPLTLRRIVHLGVVPGLVEEPDDTAAGPVNSNHPDATVSYRANRAMLEELKANGVMDPYLDRRLGDLLMRLGLDSVECEGVTWIHRGGDVAARLVFETLALHEHSGRYSRADLEATRRALSDPRFSFIDTTWFGAQGRRPTRPTTGTKTANPEIPGDNS